MKQSYKDLLKLKVGEQIVLFYNANDKAMYNQGYRWAPHRARQLVGRAQVKSNARFTTKKGALGVLVTRVADVEALPTNSTRKDMRELLRNFEYLIKLHESLIGSSTSPVISIKNHVKSFKKKYKLAAKRTTE